MKTKLKPNFLIALIVLLLIAFVATGVVLQLKLESILAGGSHKEMSVLNISRLLTALSAIAIFFFSYIIIRRLRRQQTLILQLEQSHASEIRFRQNLEKVSAEIHDLYNNAPCGYHSLDRDGYFQAINQTELNWLGYRREEVIGQLRFVDVLDEPSAMLVQNRFPQFKKNGELRELRLNMVNKKGFLIPVSLNAIAIYDEQEEYISNRSTVFDVSEQEKIEEALIEAKRMADQSASVKEQFLANMSHEIRTPINAVIGFTNLLQKTSLHPDQEQYVSLVQSASESLLTIINDILDISKIEAGMLRIEKSPFSLRGLCSSLETMFQPRVREKRLTLRFKIQEAIPDTLTGDAVRLTQILVNLINNAIKFTHDGGIQVIITALQQSSDIVRLRFVVQDTGIGIPADKLDSIFERFEQGEAHTTRKYGGTGLGLSIVRNLIELQHGSIAVKSEAGKGTAFILDLPYEILPMHDNTLPGSPGDAISSVNGSFEGVKILAVEDNQMNQLLMKHTFQQWNLHYELAENGQQAIDKLNLDKFDLVLLDIQMPVMDGYITARTIRDQLKSNIPIIAMTAHAMAGEREKCLSHGMNDYISKPIQEKELLNMLRRYLTRQKHAFENLKASLSTINIDFLYDLVMGNSAFLNNIIRQFLHQFPGEMEQLKEAIGSNDTRQVASLAHHIQSTVSVFGRNTRFFRQLEDLEKQANNKADANSLSAAYQQLDKDRHLLLMEINRLISHSTL